MSLIVLLFTVITSPWFFLLVFEKLVSPSLYLPDIKEFLINFFSYLSFDFLFFSGDSIPKNNIPEVGVFHLWELPFFLIGAYLIFSNPKKEGVIILGILLFTSFASFFKPAPNILVSLPLLFLISIIITKGIILILDKFLKSNNPAKTVFLILGVIFIFYNLFFFWHQYKVHYPKRLEKNVSFDSK